MHLIFCAVSSFWQQLVCLEKKKEESDASIGASIGSLPCGQYTHEWGGHCEFRRKLSLAMGVTTQ